MVDGKVALLEDRCQLKLVGSHLVMTGLHWDGKFQCLYLQVLHESLYTVGDSTKVVVVHLLVLGTLMSHQGAPSEHQVRTSRVESLVHEEILLLPSEVHLYFLYVVIEILANICRRLAHRMESTEEGSLIVECLTRIGDEDGGDTQGIVDDEHRRGGVPCGITTCLEGVADTAIGE